MVFPFYQFCYLSHFLSFMLILYQQTLINNNSWCSILQSDIGFFQTKNIPNVEDINFFWRLPHGFQDDFIMTPWIFRFYIKFWHTPRNSNYFYSTPWNFSLISSAGGFWIFSGKPIKILILPGLNITRLLKYFSYT